MTLIIHKSRLGRTDAFIISVWVYPPAFIITGTAAVAIGVMKEDNAAIITRIHGPTGLAPRDCIHMIVTGVKI